MLLNGKSVLITGGSRGIGREMVHLFLKEGARVYYVSTREGSHQDESRKIAEESGTSVAWYRGDVSDEEGITRTVETILEDSGGLDVLVNNAGITQDGLSFRMSSEDWDRVIKVNLYSAFYICRPVSRSMVKARSGSIINISSVVGLLGNPGQINYAASKAGLIGLTKTLAREVATRGVRVNALAPGYIATDMTKDLNDKAKDALASSIPMGRVGEPGEIAGAALFLASDYSTYVTGQVISVDGGMAM